jgi:putative hydrolase of the HAD superfamily
MIRAIVFDIGNVILRFDFGITMKRLQHQSDPISEEIVASLSALQKSYETGHITRAEFQRRVTEAVRFTGEEREFVEAWEEIFDENLPMSELIRALQPRYPLYLLSNTSDLHVDYMWRTYPIFHAFTDAVYSFRVQCFKPDRAIFEIAARQFGIDPAETVSTIMRTTRHCSTGWIAFSKAASNAPKERVGRIRESKGYLRQMNVFVSYSHADEKLAQELRSHLVKEGFSVANPGNDLTPGENYHLKLGKELQTADAMVVLISPESLGSASVSAEIDYALSSPQFRDRLISVLVKPTQEVPWILRKLQLLRATKDDAETARRVVAALQTSPVATGR